MKQIVFLSFVLLLNLQAFSQQDPQFSHDMFNQVEVNPGAAGWQKKVNATLIRRQQWFGGIGSSVDKAPTTTLGSIDASLKIFGIQSGIGLSVVQDALGFDKNTTIKASYSYKRPFYEGTLGIGIDMGIYNRALAADWIYPEGTENLVSKSGKTIFDMGFGAFYNTRNMYAGISTTHLLFPVLKMKDDANSSFVTEQKMVQHYYLMGGYTMPLGIPLMEFNPNIMIKSDLKSTQYSLNGNFIYNRRFWGGITYRHLDAISLLAGLELKSGIKFGIAYDIKTTNGSLTKGIGGSLEVMINYAFNLNLDRTPQRYKSVRFL